MADCGPFKYVHRKSSESLANARLIAAAPNLLHALKSIMADLSMRRNWLDPQTEAAALDAIAQAEGGTVDEHGRVTK